MPSISPELKEILQKYGETAEAVWNCHGTWVAYHAALERIARKAKIVFDPPTVVEADSAAKVAAICVSGKMGSTEEWSIGEAAPANNKNAYPFAMAEKRAKDRVILKLVGLHGMVYSEDESDDFKKDNFKQEGGSGNFKKKEPPNGRRQGRGERFSGPLKISELKDELRKLAGELLECKILEDLEDLEKAYSPVLSQAYVDLPKWYHGDDDAPGALAAIEEKREELMERRAA